MSFLNLMRNRLKPREVNDALMNNTVPPRSASDAGKYLGVDSSGGLEFSNPLPATTSATTGQILKLTGETKIPAWSDEYSYTPPAYSSTEEVNTGQKWTDGKDIYCKVISGLLPTIESTATVTITSDFDGTLIYGHSILFDSNNRYCDRFYMAQATTNIRLINVTTSFSALNYSAMIYYTKPDPEPEPENLTKKKKTTNK